VEDLGSHLNGCYFFSEFVFWAAGPESQTLKKEADGVGDLPGAGACASVALQRHKSAALPPG
jgi:hypothetical protein